MDLLSQELVVLLDLLRIFLLRQIAGDFLVPLNPVHELDGLHDLLSSHVVRVDLVQVGHVREVVSALSSSYFFFLYASTQLPSLLIP